MSNISRRKFLKGAGVVALAVAAAGVLAGCSGNGDKVPGTEIPDVPEVTSVDLRVLFVDEKGNPVGNGVTGHYDTTVLKDAKRYAPKLIPADKLPEGYELASEDEVDIINNGNMNLAMVPVQKPASSPASKRRVRVTFMNYKTGKSEVKDFDIDINAKQITLKDVTLPEGWAVAEGSEDWVSDIDLNNPQKGYYNATRPLVCKNA